MTPTAIQTKIDAVAAETPDDGQGWVYGHNKTIELMQHSLSPLAFISEISHSAKLMVRTSMHFSNRRTSIH